MDEDVIEMLTEPLVHLVRNSLDHGIETPQQRVALGEPGEATLLLRAAPDGDAVLVEMVDDGRGVDTGAVRTRAYRRGLATEEAPARLATDTVQRSAEDVAALVDTVTQRDRAVRHLVGEVRALDQEVNATAGIAHATTILALNAKIEAVRAGDAGAGSSVVAEEVREPSRQAAQAAEAIRSGITRVTSLMEARLGAADGGAGGTAQISARLEGIAAVQQDVAHVLSRSAEGTSGAAEQIASSIDALGRRTTAVLRGERDVASLGCVDGVVEALRTSSVSHRRRGVHAQQTGAVAVEAAAAAVELL